MTKPLNLSSAILIALFIPSKTSPPILFIFVFQVKPAMPSFISTRVQALFFQMVFSFKSDKIKKDALPGINLYASVATS